MDTNIVVVMRRLTDTKGLAEGMAPLGTATLEPMQRSTGATERPGDVAWTGFFRGSGQSNICVKPIARAVFLFGKINEKRSPARGSKAFFSEFVSEHVGPFRKKSSR